MISGPAVAVCGTATTLTKVGWILDPGLGDCKTPHPKRLGRWAGNGLSFRQEHAERLWRQKARFFATLRRRISSQDLGKVRQRYTRGTFASFLESVGAARRSAC